MSFDAKWVECDQDEDVAEFVERWRDFCTAIEESENVKRYKQSVEFINYKRGNQIRGDLDLDLEIYSLLDSAISFPKEVQDLLD